MRLRYIVLVSFFIALIIFVFGYLFLEKKNQVSLPTVRVSELTAQKKVLEVSIKSLRDKRELVELSKRELAKKYSACLNLNDKNEERTK